METPGGGGFGAPAGTGDGRDSRERDFEGFLHGIVGERTFPEPAQFGSYFDYLRTWNESV